MNTAFVNISCTANARNDLSTHKVSGLRNSSAEKVENEGERLPRGRIDTDAVAKKISINIYFTKAVL